jgi:hypothetical protein
MIKMVVYAKMSTATNDKNGGKNVCSASRRAQKKREPKYRVS